MANKVIFVQGTAFSGSTFFHLTLANDPGGFACGEVHGLFRPHKRNHVNRVCTCGYSPCRTWPAILERGETHLYASIFDLYPEVRFVVDSSKQPFWITAQNENLRRQNIEFHNMLIWKSPLEFARSKKRRGQDDWARVWLNTHRLFLTCMPGIRAVRYRDMAAENSVLPLVCRHLDIPYFSGKERYWEKSHCVLGGSNTAKFHLADRDQASQMYEGVAMSASIPHRSVEYVPVKDDDLEREVAEVLSADPRFGEIERLLEYSDVTNDAYEPQEVQSRIGAVRMPDVVIALKRAKYGFKTTAGKVRYLNAPRFRDAPPG